VETQRKNVEQRSSIPDLPVGTGVTGKRKESDSLGEVEVHRRRKRFRCSKSIQRTVRLQPTLVCLSHFLAKSLSPQASCVLLRSYCRWFQSIYFRENTAINAAHKKKLRTVIIAATHSQCQIERELCRSPGRRPLRSRTPSSAIVSSQERV
jgi:hypothetical protein